MHDPVRLPCWRYRRTPEGVEARLFDAFPEGSEWKDSPALCVAGDERADLLAEARRRGVKVDRRWGLARLREAVGDGDGA